MAGIQVLDELLVHHGLVGKCVGHLVSEMKTRLMGG